MLFKSLILTAVAGISGVLAQGTGQGTWYNPALGACGIFNTDADFIVAVGWQLFDSYPGATANPNLNPICGKTITASYQGKSIKATITDRCTGCKGNDLDFTPAAFQALIGPLSLGRVDGVSWVYGSSAPTTTTPKPTTTTTPKPPTTTPVTTPKPTTTSTSGQCAGVAAWVSNVAYTGGQKVTYNGHLWTAKWWTQADTPGGLAGVWTDSGAC